MIGKVTLREVNPGENIPEGHIVCPDCKGAGYLFPTPGALSIDCGKCETLGYVMADQTFPRRSEVVFMDNPHDGHAKFYAVADEPNWRVWRLGECGKENVVCTVADMTDARPQESNR